MLRVNLLEIEMKLFYGVTRSSWGHSGNLVITIALHIKTSPSSMVQRERRNSLTDTKEN